MGNGIKLVATAVAVVALVGCTASRPGPARPVAEIVPTAAGCDEPGVSAQLLGARAASSGATPAALPEAGTVPAGFTAVTAVECTLGPDASSVVERRLTGDLAAVTAVIDEPSARVPDDRACPAMGQVQPVLFLVDAAGRTVRAAWPLDECGFVKQQALAAVAALHVDEEHTVAAS